MAMETPNNLLLKTTQKTTHQESKDHHFFRYLVNNSDPQTQTNIEQIYQQSAPTKQSLFTRLACAKGHQVDYLQLLKLTSRFYQLPIFDSEFIDSKQFSDPFWQRWKQQNQAKPLWLHQNHLHIGIYQPNQHIDEQSIRFKFNYRCHRVLLYAPDEFITHGQFSHSDSLTNIAQEVETLIQHAQECGASDIHLEPFQDYCRIRLRCDGVLITHQQIDAQQFNAMVSRLKILANMDIAEKRLPQDGRIHSNTNEANKRDLRLSTVPTLFGEKMVIRILGQTSRQLCLSNLGLSPRQKQVLEHAINKKSGMLLVTGPTGSGKTNTLYALMQILNNDQINIISVEDPVEIYLNGINQINTNNKSGLTFAKTLRGLLRQDPDIIMVGEIRDTETADIAVKAAQTGHLLLSTLHTNDAISSIQRLNDMGIARYHLSAALNILIAQRLIRVLCSNCKQQKKYPKSIYQQYHLDPLQDTLYSASGCSACQQGYAGRTGIFEIISITPGLMQALQEQDKKTVLQELNAQHYQDLQQSAIEKVRQGITSIEEMMRVI